MNADIPLFPLNSVVCPGGRIPLQLFEPRYLRMLADCMKASTGFVIVLIREGSEVGESKFYHTGTRVKIVDFQQLENGLLGVTVEGESKVHISESYKDANGLYRGRIAEVAHESSIELPNEHSELVGILQALVKHPAVDDLNMSINFDDGRDVGWRLTELLPIAKAEKQYLLELTDPRCRLDRISEFLAHFDA